MSDKMELTIEIPMPCGLRDVVRILNTKLMPAWVFMDGNAESLADRISRVKADDKGKRYLTVDVSGELINDSPSFTNYKPVAMPWQHETGKEITEYYKLQDNVDIIDSAFYNGEGEAFARWSIVSYVIRCGRKNGEKIADLKKARHYIDRWIQQIEGESNG